MKYALAIAATLSLTGCMTSQEMLSQDVTTCTNFGAEYGSPAHYQCMMVQQQRRDYNAAVAQAQFAQSMNQLAWALR